MRGEIEMSLFHIHAWGKVKSATVIPPLLPPIQDINKPLLDDLLFDMSPCSIIDKSKVRTSVVKECECGDLREYVFEGDHTKGFPNG